jgi:hypothetical protein
MRSFVAEYAFPFSRASNISRFKILFPFFLVKKLCPQNTPITAETEKEFFIRVHRRRLRAAPDSVATESVVQNLAWGAVHFLCKKNIGNRIGHRVVWPA